MTVRSISSNLCKVIDDSTKIIIEDSSVLRKTLKKFIELTGYSVVKKRTFNNNAQIDLRSITNNPIEAVYRAGHSLTSLPNKWVIINVPMNSTIRFPMGFASNSLYPDPFAQTVIDYLEGKHIQYQGSVLERYFKSWQPKNAAELLGLREGEVNELLLKVPALGAVFPWDYDSPEERTRMNHPQDWRSCGPIPLELGLIEFERFKYVAESIKSQGYHRNTQVINGDIGAQVLVRGTQWKILICDGMHRFATLKALGWKEIPVSLRRWPMMIRREDAISWPNVVKGLFSQESALQIFDLFFEGKQPMLYKGY